MNTHTRRAFATVTGTTATFTHPDGHRETLHATRGEDIRLAVVRTAASDARRTGAAVELVTNGDRGNRHLLVDATGTITPIPPDTTPPVPEFRAQVALEADAEGEGELEEIFGSDAPIFDAVHTEPPAPHNGAEMLSGKEVRDEAPQPPDDHSAAAEPPHRPTFITPAPATPTPTTGWRGALARWGIRVAPSRAGQERAAHIDMVSRHWAGCRTIAVANGKGGVGKTMTTAMLAAVFARHGGGNVLAWDNNDTRGTLGWRTEQGLYDTTLRDLLPAAEALLDPAAGVSDIARFVHHQATDRFDVLRSNPELLAADQRITTGQFDLLMQVAARYYRLVVFDSGNDESADRWLRMIDSSWQLVIPTLASPESAESALLLLDALRGRDEHSAALAESAVVVVTQAEPAPRETRRIVDGFADHVRAVTVIPYDPALKSGPLRYDTLRPATQHAWLRAAAATATAL